MTDSLKVRCSGCSKLLKLSATTRGKTVACPSCGKQFRVPATGGSSGEATQKSKARTTARKSRSVSGTRRSGTAKPKRRQPVEDEWESSPNDNDLWDDTGGYEADDWGDAGYSDEYSQGAGASSMPPRKRKSAGRSSSSGEEDSGGLMQSMGAQLILGGLGSLVGVGIIIMGITQIGKHGKAFRAIGGGVFLLITCGGMVLRAMSEDE